MERYRRKPLYPSYLDPVFEPEPHTVADLTTDEAPKAQFICSACKSQTFCDAPMGPDGKVLYVTTMRRCGGCNRDRMIKFFGKRGEDVSPEGYTSFTLRERGLAKDPHGA